MGSMVMGPMVKGPIVMGPIGMGPIVMCKGLERLKWQAHFCPSL